MTEFDVIVIGSGFGGSVTAMRLAQKGYRVGVLEAGKRFRAKDFPKSNWNVRKYFWAPWARCFGFQRITLLKGLMILHGTGVGGGSLVYANTLMEPHAELFDDPVWPSGVNWKQELSPHFSEARRMLGVTRNPILNEGEKALEELGRRMGIADTFHPTEVGVFFGVPDRKVRDPYFSGAGPDRTGCNFCGGCMVGCRFEAKNTLDYNYLHFAEKFGARIFPETQVIRIVPPEHGGGHYRVETRRSTAWFGQKGETFTAPKVVLSAGVLGTVEILLRNRDEFGTLSRLSPRLGETVRTNGESLLGATSFDRHRDLSRGIAIGAAIHPDARTKIEGVRFPSGSGAMRLLGVPLTPDGGLITRPLKLLGIALSRIPQWIRLWMIRDWARNTLILLVMQSVDSKMRLKLGRSVHSWLRKGLMGESEGEPMPSYLPVAQSAARKLAEVIHGEPQNVLTEVLLRTPATAHILGGCCIGESTESGVIDSRHEVFGYPGLFVCDGSVIPANLGVNPSLTISAMAERFAHLWPLAAGTSESDREERRIQFGRA